MATLQELKRRNEKLRNELAAQKELSEIEKERRQLLKENNQLLFKQRHPGLIRGGEFTGKVLKRVGTQTGKGLSIWLKTIKKNQMKGKMLQKKAMKIKKKATKKKVAKKRIVKRTVKKKRKR